MSNSISSAVSSLLVWGAPGTRAEPEAPAPEGWSPYSWQARADASQLAYTDEHAANQVMLAQNALPPLVPSSEVEQLKALLVEAQEGHRFLLQAGDCAERFSDIGLDSVRSKLRIMNDLAAILSDTGRTPVCIGRIAGQYAKPRSSAVEVRGGVAHPSYFGDLHNDLDFSAESRRLDPVRLRRGYECAAETLESMRTIDALEPGVRCFTSHEGLNLRYEASLTRFVDEHDGYYDLSTHLPWIGERTRSLVGAHVEFFRGIRNPIAVKVGPRCTPMEVMALIDTLNPRDEPGRLTLISRMGADHIERALPALVRTVKRSGRRVLWVCDPMHGNTESTASGYKTRRLERIAREVELSFRIHAAQGVPLGGIHLEATDDAVTECLGEGVTEADIGQCYTTACDPRLNRKQAIALVSRFAEFGA